MAGNPFAAPSTSTTAGTLVHSAAKDAAGEIALCVGLAVGAMLVIRHGQRIGRTLTCKASVLHAPRLGHASTRFAIAAGGAWGGILALAWHLANARIALCDAGARSTEAADRTFSNCMIRATAARDAMLIWGLAIGAVLAVGMLVSRSMQRRVSGPPGFNQGRGQ